MCSNNEAFDSASTITCAGTGADRPVCMLATREQHLLLSRDVLRRLRLMRLELERCLCDLKYAMSQSVVCHRVCGFWSGVAFG